MPRTSVNHSRYADEPESFLTAALALAARRPFDALAAALAAACTVMIFVNALVLQQGRGPLPPSARAQATLEPARPQARPEAPKRSELVEQVQTALAERGLYDGVVDGLHGAATTAAIRAFEQAHELNPTGEASERVLAALLTAPMRGAAPAPATQTKQTPPTQPAAANVPNPKLLAMQRALAKIGYGPSVIDGRLGAETRNAIKAFERDRGMPETGEPSPQVLRALQAMTGAPLQ